MQIALNYSQDIELSDSISFLVKFIRKSLDIIDGKDNRFEHTDVLIKKTLVQSVPNLFFLFM